MKLINFIKGILKDNVRKKIYSSAIFLGLLLIVVGVTIFAFGKQTFGWFASNKEVSSNGMSVSLATDDVAINIYDENMVLLEDNADINFNLNLPGASKYFVLEFVNNMNKDVSISRIGFLEPNSAEEIPVVDSGTNYYFSTQILIMGKNLGTTKPTSSNLTSNFTSSEVGNFLTATPNEGEDINLTSFTIWEEDNLDKMIISPNSKYYLAIKITFYNNPTASQNQYRNFGKSTSITPDACCKRRIFIEI